MKNQKITSFLSGNRESGYDSSNSPVIQESKNGDPFCIAIVGGYYDTKKDTLHRSSAVALFEAAEVLKQLKVGTTI